MLFNVDIRESLYLDGRKNSSATVMLDGNENPIVNCIKDLGIYVQSSTSWKGHIQAKLVAARKSFQFLKRTILIMSLSPQNFYFTASVSIVYFCMAPKSGTLN